MDTKLACPICSSTDLSQLKRYNFRSKKATGRTEKLLSIYHEKFNPSGEVTVEQCQNCGFIWTNPRLDDQDLKEKYRAIAQFDLDNRSSLPPFLKERRERATTLLSSFLPEGANARILDYGGAEGFLLSPLIDQGHQGFVVDYIDYPRPDDRITYLGNSLEALESEEKFDLIIVLHTLEHVGDPVGMLGKLAQLLKPGGKIYVEVPLGIWLEWTNLREPLTHINYFGELSLVEAGRMAGLHPHFVNSAWQYVTHPEKTLCINAIFGLEPSGLGVTPLSPEAQMHPLSQGVIPLKVNGRYYGKTIIRALLKI